MEKIERRINGKETQIKNWLLSPPKWNVLGNAVYAKPKKWKGKKTETTISKKNGKPKEGEGKK